MKITFHIVDFIRCIIILLCQSANPGKLPANISLQDGWEQRRAGTVLFLRQTQLILSAKVGDMITVGRIASILLTPLINQV